MWRGKNGENEGVGKGDILHVQYILLQKLKM